MRIIFLFLLLAVSRFNFAQITLSNMDFSDAGDTIRVSVAAPDPSIDFLTTGPNQNWDFSFLTAQDQNLLQYNDLSSASFLVEFQFGSFASADYQATNFTENSDIPLDQISSFLPVSITAVYGYSKNTADSITSLGYSMDIDGFEVPIQSDTIETRYKFPLNFNDAYSSRGYTYLDMNPIYNGIWIQYRERNSVVDGWGSITTPYGTFDALRIKHTINETDSIYMDLFGSPQWIGLPIPESNIYEWITNGEKEPVLRITTSNAFGNEAITDVTYKDNYLGLDASLTEHKLNVNCYPNPVVNTLHVSIEGNTALYELVTTDGRTLKSGNLKPNDIVNFEGVPAGNYMIKIHSGLKTAIIPIIKQ